MGTAVIRSVAYWLSEHPTVVGFRWSHSQSVGATWLFLFSSISFYIAAASVLLLAVRRRERSVPLGPIPALHSLAMALVSALIFAGILLSAAAEIRDTRWFWRRTHTTPFQWFLCFPLGTRPSGRVFFWSYIFYLSRFLHMVRTFLTVLRSQKLAFVQLFNNSILTFMSFMWLEFSQSLQVLAILCTTLMYSVIYGYRFWIAIGLPGACFPFVLNCQIVLLVFNLVCHVGVLMFHFIKGGCNGIGAWVFNSILNGAILMLFMNFYVRRVIRIRRRQKMMTTKMKTTMPKKQRFEVDVNNENYEVEIRNGDGEGSSSSSPVAVEKLLSSSGSVESRSQLKLNKIAGKEE